MFAVVGADQFRQEGLVSSFRHDALLVHHSKHSHVLKIWNLLEGQRVIVRGIKGVGGRV